MDKSNIGDIKWHWHTICDNPRLCKILDYYEVEYRDIEDWKSITIRHINAIDLDSNKIFEVSCGYCDLFYDTEKECIDEIYKLCNENPYWAPNIPNFLKIIKRYMRMQNLQNIMNG